MNIKEQQGRKSQDCTETPAHGKNSIRTKPKTYSWRKGGSSLFHKTFGYGTFPIKILKKVIFRLRVLCILIVCAVDLRKDSF